MSFCKVVLLGNIGRDPEVRMTSGGKAVANFSVATTYKRNGEDQTLWHRVVCYERLADVVSNYAAKGRQVFIEGRLNYSTYTDKNGVEKQTTEIIATELTLLGPKGGSRDEPPPPKQAPAVEEDLPF
jgi:single-strand DNA-binding protein